LQSGVIMDWDDVLTTEWVGEIPALAPALAGVTFVCWVDG